jgi:hypothetical protein
MKALFLFLSLVFCMFISIDEPLANDDFGETQEVAQPYLFFQEVTTPVPIDKAKTEKRYTIKTGADYKTKTTVSTPAIYRKPRDGLSHN